MQQSPDVEYADPAIAKAMAHWRELTEAVERAKEALAAAIAARRVKICESDRRIIREAKKSNPDLVLLETDGELLPARCMVSGLAIFAGDELVGDVEVGAVLKGAVTLAAGAVKNAGRSLARNLATMPALLATVGALWPSLSDCAVTPFVLGLMA
jgi:hypothetical protein